MKILHVIPSLSAVHGGPSRAMHLIEQALLGQGVEVEIATTDDDGSGRRVAIVSEVVSLPEVNSLPTCGEGWGGDESFPLPASPTYDFARASARSESESFRTSGGGVNPQGWGVRRYFPKRTEFYKVSPGFARWVFRHVRDYDLIHIHALFSFTSIAAAWAARWAGVPYVVRPLGTLNQYGVTKRRPWLKRLSLKLIEAPILRHAAAVHFTAEAEQREAEALGIPMRGVVIPLGVEVLSPSRPPPQVGEGIKGCPSLVGEGIKGCPSLVGEDATAKNSLPTCGEGWGGECLNPLWVQFPQLAGKRVVLFLSRLDAKKNLEGLLKAFGLLADEIPDLHLLVAGDGEPAYVAGLKKLAENLRLADRVTWAGHLDGELKASAFAAASVFALPSYSENFGIAAAEALLAGLPCVLGEGVAIAGEVAQAGAGVTVSPEPQSIAGGLATLLADERLRVDMAHKAAAFAREKYSVEAMGAELVRLYEGIVVV